MKKQKLSKRTNTYTPTNASQVCSSVAMSLNREETLSEHGLKTFDNNLEENHSQHRENPDLRVQDVVYVLNMRGQPLMPTKQQKANKLLKQNKAKVTTCKPFTIQLNYATGEAKQPITLGIDAGYQRIGFSVITDKKELVSGDLHMRTNISKKISERRGARRLKRNRLWHRKPRFLNRVRTKSKGWLAPSILHKLDTHIKLVNKIKTFLPITKTIIEVAKFDCHKLVNPEINGIEYQQGTLQGYNIRQYLLEKWHYRCVYCKKKNVPLEIEHMTPKSRGGSNRVVNLTISCHDCNQKKGDMTVEEFGFSKLRIQADKTFKDSTFMNIVRWRLVNQLNTEHTYGHITKHNRIKHGLEKSHINDAFIIAGGTNQKRNKPYILKQIRRNNRCLQKQRAHSISIRRQRHKLQPNDLVKFKNKLWKVIGTFNKGISVGLTREEIKKYPNTKNVELIRYGKGIWN